MIKAERKNNKQNIEKIIRCSNDKQLFEEDYDYLWTRSHTKKVKIDHQPTALIFARQYINKVLKKHRFPTKAGFATFCGFSSAKAVWDHCNQIGADAKDSISRIYTIFEDILAQVLLNPEHRNVNGSKFYFQAQYGWTEKQEYKDVGNDKVIVLDKAVDPTSIPEQPQKRTPVELTANPLSKKSVDNHNKSKIAEFAPQRAPKRKEFLKIG